MRIRILSLSPLGPATLLVDATVSLLLSLPDDAFLAALYAAGYLPRNPSEYSLEYHHADATYIISRGTTRVLAVETYPDEA